MLVLVSTALFQMRPTQVKATKDFPEITVPKDYLYYRAYDVIVVIDKRYTYINIFGEYYMSHDVGKTVLGVSNQVRHKPTCTVT